MFDFKNLWENVGRWVVPGGLVIDFVSKYFKEEPPVLSSEVFSALESSADILPTEVGPVRVVDTFSVSNALESFNKMQEELSRLEQKTDLLFSEEIRRDFLKEALIQGVPEEIFKASLEKETVIVHMPDGRVIGADAEQFRAIESEINEAAAAKAKLAGGSAPEPVTAQTVAVMLERMNDLAKSSSETVGIYLEPTDNGSFQLHALTSTELYKKIEPTLEQARIYEGSREFN